MLALFWACRTGVEGTVRLSVQAGAHIDAPNNVRQSPFSVAAEHGHVSIMKLLYDTKQVNIDSKDFCSLTPLSHAAVSGQERAVKFLLDTKKVDIDVTDLNNEAPLSLVEENGHELVVKLLFPVDPGPSICILTVIWHIRSLLTAPQAKISGMIATNRSNNRTMKD